MIIVSYCSLSPGLFIFYSLFNGTLSSSYPCTGLLFLGLRVSVSSFSLPGVPSILVYIPLTIMVYWYVLVWEYSERETEKWCF